MASKKKDTHIGGASAFEAYYAQLFAARWESLKTSLEKEHQHSALIGLNKHYYMDAASIIAASALPPLESGTCLDMCAAPGGKTLVLSQTMGQDVEICANDLSRDRHARLRRVLDEHLPPENRARIQSRCGNAALLAKKTEQRYDRILLDAPCSSERHLLQNPKHLKQWSPSRIKQLAQRQWSLLSAAFLLLKQDGYVLYSTCALTEHENDAQIARLIKKYGEHLRICNTHTYPFAEQTAYGHIFLPDHACGLGPLYFALIQKTS